MSLRADWPLVGRADELRLAFDTLATDATSVVLAGAAGVGKTRLMRELLGQLRETGGPISYTVGTAAAAKIPFGSLIPLVPDLGEAFDSLELAHKLFNALGDKTQAILAIDDAHLLDELSASVVHQLVVGRRGRALLTIRSGEPCPDPLWSLQKDAYAHRFELQALSRVETERLVSAALGGVVATRTLARLYEVSVGNPLYLREVVLSALDSGALANDRGVWEWTGEAKATPLLEDLVSSRLGNLEPVERRALEVLALGEPLPLDEFVRLTSSDVVAELERKGLLTEERSSGHIDVRLVHPLYAEVLRTKITPRDADSARRSLLEAFDSKPDHRPEEVLRMAVLQLESGLTDRPELLVQGADHALLATDWYLGLRLAEAAYDIAPSAETALHVARARSNLGHYREAVEIGRPFLSDRGDRVQCQLARSVANTLFVGLDRGEEAEQVYLTAATNAPEGPSRDLLLALRTMVLPTIGRAAETLDLGLAALRDEELDGAAKSLYTSMAARVLAGFGRSNEAIDLIDEHLPSIYATDDIQALIETFTSRCIALVFAGRLDEGAEFIQPLYDAAAQTGNDAGRIAGASALVAFNTMAGRPRTACDLASTVFALWTSAGHHELHGWILSLYAESLSLLGAAEEAEDALSGTDSQLRPNRFYESDIKRVRAWISAARGEVSHARTVAVEAADDARSNGWPSFELLARHDAIRLGASKECERVQTLAERCQGEFARAVAMHSRGLATNHPATILSAVDAFEATGLVLRAAEAAAQAAAMFAAEGRHAIARSAAERFRGLAAMCEGARTPILAAGPARDPLTPREREVAELAARGLTNKQIAEKLVASVRTIEGHLYQAYAKLGVEGRTALAGLLGAVAREDK